MAKYPVLWEWNFLMICSIFRGKEVSGDLWFKVTSFQLMQTVIFWSDDSMKCSWIYTETAREPCKEEEEGDYCQMLRTWSRDVRASQQFMEFIHFSLPSPPSFCWSTISHWIVYARLLQKIKLQADSLGTHKTSVQLFYLLKATYNLKQNFYY